MPRGPRGVRRPSRKAAMGQEALPEGGSGQEAILEGRKGSGVSPGGLGGVNRLS